MGVINRIHRLGAWILGSFFLREFIPKIRAYILQSRQRNIAQTCRIYARFHTASRCEVVSSVPITLWRWTSRIAVSLAQSDRVPVITVGKVWSRNETPKINITAKIFAERANKTRLKICRVRRIKSEIWIIVEKNESISLINCSLRKNKFIFADTE